MSFGIYIHWPFCLSKCPYCDFYSVVKDIPQKKIIDEYIEDLEFYNSFTQNRNITSIFFGGGTPSLIEPKYIALIIDKIHSLWHISGNVEISLEANPNSNKPNLFNEIKKAGVNRLSLGIQSLRDEDLFFLGRTHSKKDALLAIDDVLKNFDNHSLDFIYARPKQKIDEWERELKQILGLGIKHISLYQLTIEKGTIFHKKGIKPLEDEQAEEMYKFTINYLKQKNYFQYEVSNFALEGFECSHNKIYWSGGEYIGIGKGAHGRIFANNQWIATEHKRKFQQLNNEERATELLIMGLRLRSGINKQNFKRLCNISLNDFINNRKKETLIEQNLLIETKDNLTTTDKGLLLLNYVINELYC